MLKYSKHNILSRIRDSGNYFIVNTLSGNADLLSPEEFTKIENVRERGESAEPEFAKELAAKGYLVREDEERKLFRSRYLDFLDSRDREEIQIFFVPGYSCNFSCSYCYQDQYTNLGPPVNNEIIDAFFSYVGSEFRGRKKYITIFGGEPLLGSPAQKKIISYVVNKAAKSGVELCFVTNGYFLEEYSDILRGAVIREIQVTLDGTEIIHDSRRSLKGGGGTFAKIVEGIDSFLSRGISINLRMVIDRDNIENLPALARFAIDKGWTGSRSFKTQIGRNYELHHCQSSPDRLFSRISLYERISDLVKEHPYITEFYKPAYSISRFIAENGELPDPLFDACPACKSEWAFDYTGRIYSCTATVGKQDESLGTFYPVVTKREEIIEQWENRDVTSIPTCKDCSLQLACGGGCGSVAKNRSGSICSADCRPVKELLELGFAAYLNK